MGIPLTALIVAPWLIAIAFASHGAFYQASLGNDFLSKITSAQELHGFPPGFYFVALAVTFWPSGLIVAAALPAIWRRRRLPAYRFLLAWLIPSWIAMEVIPTKLVHYVLPLYPALALMAASIFADRGISLASVWRHLLGKAAIGLWILVGCAGVLVLALGGWRVTGSVEPIEVVARRRSGGGHGCGAMAASARQSPGGARHVRRRFPGAADRDFRHPVAAP